MQVGAVRNPPSYVRSAPSVKKDVGCWRSFAAQTTGSRWGPIAKRTGPGRGHHAALRALGNRWLEILWHCLRKGVLYDEVTPCGQPESSAGTGPDQRCLTFGSATALGTPVWGLTKGVS